MARAKRTDRAEARRRYRASFEAQSVATDDGDGDGAGEPNVLTGAAQPNRLSRLRSTIVGAPQQAPAPTAGPAPKPARPVDPLAPGPAPQARPGLMNAIRGSIRPLDFRSDIRALPALTLHSRAIWLPGLLVIVAGVLAIVPNLMSTNAIAELYVSLFLYPPMAAPFLAGILAPRAGWLAGYIVSLIAGILVGAAVLTGPSGTASASAVVIDALIVMPIFGAFVGGFAAFYKRFLKLSNPNSGRPRSANRSSNRRPAKATARR